MLEIRQVLLFCRGLIKQEVPPISTIHAGHVLSNDDGNIICAMVGFGVIVIIVIINVMSLFRLLLLLLVVVVDFVRLAIAVCMSPRNKQSLHIL